MKLFEVKEEHLKLLRNTHIGWEDCEFGAPAIDCKRPYGNSDVYTDMREILGSEYTNEELRRLHVDLQTVLQIAVFTGEFRIGFYEASDYNIDWKLRVTQ